MSVEIVLTSNDNFLVRNIPILFATAVHDLNKKNNISELGSNKYYSSINTFKEAVKLAIQSGELTKLCPTTFPPVLAASQYISTDDSVVTVKNLSEFAATLGFNILIKQKSIGVSQAPGPITPVRFSSTLKKNDVDINPRWEKWNRMFEVKMWEAVALSLNIEPDNVKMSGSAWMGALHPFIESNDFNDRLEVLRQHSSSRKHFPNPCILNKANWWQCQIRLSEFVAWCNYIKYNIPSELEDVLSVESNGSVNNSTINQLVKKDLLKDGSSDWRINARIIADEIFDRDTKIGTRDSLIRRKNGNSEIVGGYAMRVMEEMQKREVHGPRGRICSAATIAREALQGNKWWSNKTK